MLPNESRELLQLGMIFSDFLGNSEDTPSFDFCQVRRLWQTIDVSGTLATWCWLVTVTSAVSGYVPIPTPYQYNNDTYNV